MLNVNTFKSFFAILAVVAIGSFSAFAASEDEGLYDPVPPEGSAFVRFIHAEVGESEIPPIVNGKSRDGVKFGGIKPYGVVQYGPVKVSFGKAETEFTADKGGHYTVILQGGKLRVEKDPEPESELKSQIIVYNLTARDNISIKTSDGKVSVIGPLKANEISTREVNPIKVSFAVFSGDEKFVELMDWPLERGESYIIAIVEDAGKGTANYDRSRVSDE